MPQGYLQGLFGELQVVQVYQRIETAAHSISWELCQRIVYLGPSKCLSTCFCFHSSVGSYPKRCSYRKRTKGILSIELSCSYARTAFITCDLTEFFWFLFHLLKTSKDKKQKERNKPTNKQLEVLFLLVFAKYFLVFWKHKCCLLIGGISFF